MPAPLPPAKPTLAQLLDVERDHPRHTGRKDEAIRRGLGITPARYYQLLHRAIQEPDAAAADPILVGRLRNRAAGITPRFPTTE